jgi:DNA segregation ATPase FtsK/SpoIIIE, S-DNA-T family
VDDESIRAVRPDIVSMSISGVRRRWSEPNRVIERAGASPIASSSALAAFSDIVRMGPFAGVHIVLASQTLSAMPAMDRPTLMLLSQRVAFMCNEYDAEIVMGEQNKAARFLSRIGEGIFNPARGEESRNQPFQGLYIPADDRTRLIRDLAAKGATAGWRRLPRVFDGDTVVARPVAPAGVPARSRGLEIPLGEPFSLEDQEGITLRRTRGANVALLGDSDDDLADLAIRGALHSVIAAARSAGAGVTVADFIGEEDTGQWLTVMDVARALGAAYTRSRGAESALRRLAGLAGQRLAAEDYRAPGEVLILFGLQRALSFGPADPYAFEQDGEPPAAALLGRSACWAAPRTSRTWPPPAGSTETSRRRGPGSCSSPIRGAARPGASAATRS